MADELEADDLVEAQQIRARAAPLLPVVQRYVRDRSEKVLRKLVQRYEQNLLTDQEARAGVAAIAELRKIEVDLRRDLDAATSTIERTVVTR